MDGLMGRYRLGAIILIMGICTFGMATPEAGTGDKYTKAAAERMISAAEGTLAPVYVPLAQEMAQMLGLGEKEGVGIDLGSGPGTLIVELCRHTKLHWINADINPHFFPYFMRQAEAAGFGGRVSAVRADAQALPAMPTLSCHAVRFISGRIRKRPFERSFEFSNPAAPLTLAAACPIVCHWRWPVRCVANTAVGRNTMWMRRSGNCAGS